MAYRRKIIDRRTREGKALGKQIDTLLGFGILALIAGVLVFGHGHSDKASGDGQDPVGNQGRAPPLENIDPPASSTPTVASTTLAMGSAPLSTPAFGADAGPTRQMAPWQHVTDRGVRWSFRHLSAASMLVVDLGGGQVANVHVAPAFDHLDLAGMNDRADYLRSFIVQYFPLQTADYSFDRDGIVRQLGQN